MREHFVNLFILGLMACDAKSDGEGTSSKMTETAGVSSSTSSSTTGSSVTTPTTTIDGNGSATAGTGSTTTTTGMDTGTTMMPLTVGPDYECGNGTQEGDEECDDGNALAGDGCGVGCAAEADFVPIIFVTSKYHHGRFGYNAGGAFDEVNKFCQDTVDTYKKEGHKLPGQYKSIISGNSLDNLVPKEAMWILRNGKPVAKTEDLLAGGGVMSAINIDESGKSVGADVFAWTGNGDMSEYSCGGWVKNDAGSKGVAGDANAMDSTWRKGDSDKWGCNNEHRVYCFRHK